MSSDIETLSAVAAANGTNLTVFAPLDIGRLIILRQWVEEDPFLVNEFLDDKLPRHFDPTYHPFDED